MSAKTKTATAAAPSKPRRQPDPWAPPKYLCTAGKREWRRVVDLLRERNGLDQLHHEALLRYIAGWTLHQRTAAELPNAKDVVTIEALSQALGRAGRQLRAAAQDLGIKPPALEGRADDDGGIKRHPNYYFGFDENNKWVGLPNTGKPQ